MAQNYIHHYPEIDRYVDEYLNSRREIWDNSKVIVPEDPETFLKMVNIAVAGGCYYMRPDVALYLMRVNMSLYVTCVANYLTGSHIDPSRINIGTSLITTFLTSVGREMSRWDHHTYIRGVLDDLPINDFFKDDIWNTACSFIANNPVPPRSAH